jgi:hypothetical protein
MLRTNFFVRSAKEWRAFAIHGSMGIIMDPMQVLSDGLAEGITVGNDVTYTMTSLGRVYSILWPVVACAECVVSKYGQGGGGGGAAWLGRPMQ